MDSGPDTTAPVALLTGSEGEIGAAITSTLQRDGFRVVGLDRERRNSGVDQFHQVDITDEVAATQVAASSVAEAGRLDAVVHCAGVMLREPFETLDLAKARAVFDVNIWGALAVMQGALPALRGERPGSVTFITSVNGQLGMVGGTAYGMSKAALHSLVRTWAVEWGPDDVRVNAVSPAIVPTEMNRAVRSDPDYLAAKLAGIPLGRMIEISEVAEAVAFLAGPRSSGITGAVLQVDGGALIKG